MLPGHHLFSFPKRNYRNAVFTWFRQSSTEHNDQATKGGDTGYGCYPKTVTNVGYTDATSAEGNYRFTGFLGNTGNRKDKIHLTVC